MDPESDIDVGTRYLALSGRIWTVRNITPHPERFVLMRPSIDGDRGMIVDSAALSRMVRIESSQSDVTIEGGRASASHDLDPGEYATPDGCVTEHSRVPASASTPSTRPPRRADQGDVRRDDRPPGHR
jgi:hypothetical protein